MRYLSVRNRAILREMVSTDFKIRYQGSVLGYMWSLLKPLFMFAILYVVFTQVFSLGKDVENFPVYLLLGIVLWSFFTEATSTGLTSVVTSGDLIRKISIPRYLIVVASSASALINLALNILVVILFAFINQVDVRWDWLLMPLVILELYVLSQAVAFLLAALYVKFRDINHIWELILQAGFYATPILYPMTLVPGDFQKYILMNPVAQIIQDARYLFVTEDTVTLWQIVSFPWSLLPVALIVLLAILASVYFKKQSNTFAENI